MKTISERAEREMPDGIIPLVSVEGTARECGRAYAEAVLEAYPGYMRYLSAVTAWKKPGQLVSRLFEEKAPHIPEVFQGMLSALSRGSGHYAATGDKKGKPSLRPGHGGCTSFSIAPGLTLDKMPISGQTKDADYGGMETIRQTVFKFIVLRMRIKDAPEILVLAYPGEFLGYGMWSTGMTIFRNSLYSRANTKSKLSMVEWGLLALSGSSVYEAGELAEKYGIMESGNCLITDGTGESISVEFNAAGADFIPSHRGINVHANHPVGKNTVSYEDYPDPKKRANSRYRVSCLWKYLDAERGRLAAQRCVMGLADHSRYPAGICQHVSRSTDTITVTAVVAEPAKGKLHVVRGGPCSNWPVTFSL
jgi:hypothetical protein